MTAAAVPEKLKVCSVAGKFQQAFKKKFGKEGSDAEEKSESKAEAKSEGDKPMFGKKAKAAKGKK